MSANNKKLKTKLSEVPTVAANDELKVSRRSFIIGSSAAVAGIAMGFALTSKSLSAAGVKKLVEEGAFSPDLNVSINRDGSIIFNSWNAEMGQHVATVQAQIFCEELEANLDDIRINYPDNNLKQSMSTSGSGSVTKKFASLSQAGAAARIMLLGIAANYWGVPIEQLSAKNSEIIDKKTGKKLSYGYLAQLGAKPISFTKDQLKAIKLKPASKRTLIGKPIVAFDIPDKTNGKAIFGIDVDLPNMAVGVPAPPPVRLGATVKSVDDSRAKKMPGFIKAVVINDPFRATTGFVVAIADTYWNAYLAARALKIEYNLGPNTKIGTQHVFDRAEELHKDPKTKWAPVGTFGMKNKVIGDPHKALKSADKTLTETYFSPYAVHAALEPMNATGVFKDGKWHFYLSVQNPNSVAKVMAGKLKVKPNEIVIHRRLVGGGFGRRASSMHDVVYMAAASSKAINRPVKVIYPREVDMQFGFYRPTGHMVLSAGLDKQGKVDVFKKNVVCEVAIPSLAKKLGWPLIATTRNAWYSFPHDGHYWKQNDLGQRATQVTAWRAVYNNADYFSLESFMDELAHAQNKDPIDFRLEYLTGEGRQAGKMFGKDGALRLKAALQAVANQANYQMKPGENRGMGVSATSTLIKFINPTFIGCIADVEVDPNTGKFKVHHLYFSVDNGLAVNPDAAEAQIMSGALWGLDNTLNQDITMTNGMIDQANYDGFTPVRMKDVPELHIEFLGAGKYPPTGLGEMGTPAVAPAIANAIYNAVGARVRRLAITPERIMAALNNKS